MTVGTEPIPAGLEWGQVLVSMRAAPISPADIYTAATGGALGTDVQEPPYVAGHDGIGVVQKVLLRMILASLMDALQRCRVYE